MQLKFILLTNNIDIKIKDCMLGRMTNVLQFTDKSYVHLDQVPELVKLYAEIDCNSDDCILEKSNIAASEIERRKQSRKNNEERAIRIPTVRQAFLNCAKMLPEYRSKPVNDEFVDGVKHFFMMALLAGYRTLNDLHEKIDVSSSPEDFEILSNSARDARIIGEEKRRLGRVARDLEKEYAKEEAGVIAPLQAPHVVGQGPR